MEVVGLLHERNPFLPPKQLDVTRPTKHNLAWLRKKEEIIEYDNYVMKL